MKQTLVQSGLNQHTLEYSSSPKLCGPSLNISEEKEKCAGLTNCTNPPKRNPQGEVPGQMVSKKPLPRICYNSSVVCVRSMTGKELEPTYPRSARILLKEGRAKVVCRKPFTIQLNHGTLEYITPKEVKLDTGGGKVGISVCTTKRELFSAELELRMHKIVEEISTKKMYRNSRRSRKTRYRESRWMNRAIPKGWLPPSTQHGINSHINLILFAGKYIPLDKKKTKIIAELAKFDIQKINNPDIQGKGYQEGPQLGFQNTRAYVLYRDNYTCVNCGICCFGKGKTRRIEVHHKESRKTGGNSPGDLVCLCDVCHDKQTRGLLDIDFLMEEVMKNNARNRADTFMSILRTRLPEMLKELGFKVEETFGYITKYKREQLGLEKSHANDAYSMGEYHPEIRCETYRAKEKRRNNRCLQKNIKGRKPSIRRKRYDLQPDDVVKYDGKVWEVVGIHNCGKSVILRRGEEKVDKSPKKVKVVKYNRGIYVKEFG